MRPCYRHSGPHFPRPALLLNTCRLLLKPFLSMEQELDVASRKTRLAPMDGDGGFLQAPAAAPAGTRTVRASDADAQGPSRASGSAARDNSAVWGGEADGGTRRRMLQ